MTVLIVDDEPREVELMRRILESAGYRPLTAGSAAEALQVFKAARDEIELLVCDVVMPEVDGPTLAEQLRASKPSLRVLFVSGFLARYEWVGLGEPAAGRRFLAKPFSPAKLIHEVKQTLAGKH